MSTTCVSTTRNIILLSINCSSESYTRERVQWCSSAVVVVGLLYLFHIISELTRLVAVVSNMFGVDEDPAANKLSCVLRAAWCG